MNLTRELKLTRSISSELMFGLIPAKLLELSDRDGIDNESDGVARDAEVGEVHCDGGRNDDDDDVDGVMPCEDIDVDVGHPVELNENWDGLETGGGVVTSLSRRTYAPSLAWNAT